MPRIRPLKTQEAISRVPIEEPVVVELVEEEIKDAAPENEEKKVNGKDKAEPAEKVVEASEKEPVVEEKESEVPALKEQLERLTKAEKEQAAAHQRQIQEITRRASEAEERAKTFENGEEDAKYTATLNAIGQATAESESAQRDFEKAVTDGDAKAQADAQRRMARSEARLERLEDGKAAFEAKREETKNAKPEPKREPAQADILETHIETIGVNGLEKTWLRDHKDYLTDGKKNMRLGNAHLDAEEAGHARGSQAYINFIEERLGLRKPAKAEQKIEQDDDEPETRSPNVAAPVSRDAPSLSKISADTNRITLSAEERAAAKASGVTEIEYATQKKKLLQMKKEGYYNEH